MVFIVLYLSWNYKQYFCQQCFLVPCCIYWWTLAYPHAATQHARDNVNINVSWAVASNKVLPDHSIGNYRHSHHDVMEVWIMAHFGKENITFFFKQNRSVSQCLWAWQNFPTIISQRDIVTDRQANSGSLGPWI